MYLIQIWFGMAKKKNKNDCCTDGIVLVNPYCNLCRRNTSPFSVGYMEKQNLHKSLGLSGIMTINSKNNHPAWLCIFCFGGYNLQRYSIENRCNYRDIANFFEDIYNNPRFPKVRCYTCKNLLKFCEGIWCDYNGKHICVCNQNCIESFMIKEVTNYKQEFVSEDDQESEASFMIKKVTNYKQEFVSEDDDDQEPKEKKHPEKKEEKKEENISSFIDETTQLKLEIKKLQQEHQKLLKTIKKLSVNVPQKKKTRIRQTESDANSKEENNSGNESDTNSVTDSVDSLSSISNISG